MDLEPLRIDRSSSPRRRGGSLAWLPKATAAGGVVLVLLLLWIFWAPLSRSIDSVRLTEVRAARVEYSHPAALGAVRGVAANGYVVAARRAALSADTPGRIVEMHVTEGSLVKKGEVVARLYAEEYEAALRRAEADVTAAQASVARATAASDSARTDTQSIQSRREAAQNQVEADASRQALARQELERIQRLLESGSGSRRDLDQAQSACDQAEAQLRASRALLRAADSAIASGASQVGVTEADVAVTQAQLAVVQAARDQAEATLKKTEVRAPFDGIVVLKDAEVGEVVSVQGGGNARGSVVTMVDLASLEVQADVPETTLSAVRVGGPAQIFLDAYPGKAFGGRVDRVWPTANRSKATVEVRIAFLEQSELLRPEMGVRVVFLPEGDEGDEAQPATSEEPQKALLISEDALVRLDGELGVFVVERDLVSFRRLDLGDRRAGKIEVSSGLEEGERIVLDPPATLESGSRVLLKGD